MIQHHHIGEEPIALDARALGDYWPGIQLYYPPVKYAPSLGSPTAHREAETAKAHRG